MVGVGESARERLRPLVSLGVPNESDEMRQAYLDFKELDRQWKALEKQHLELREEVVKK